MSLSTEHVATRTESSAYCTGQGAEALKEANPAPVLEASRWQGQLACKISMEQLPVQLSSSLS